MEYLISYKNISIQDGVKPSFNMCYHNHVHGYIMKVVTFGEIMLRLKTPENLRIM